MNCIRWRIKDGRDINILDQVWIWDRALNNWPTFCNADVLEGLSVADFLDENGWDRQKLMDCFGQDMVEVICAIPIFGNEESDMMELIKKPIGRTITSLAYNMLFQHWEDPVVQVSKLKLHPREKIFWWRIYLGIIPTNSWLQARGLEGEISCPMGCNEIENLDHVTTTCKDLIETLDMIGNWG